MYFPDKIKIIEASTREELYQCVSRSMILIKHVVKVSYQNIF